MIQPKREVISQLLMSVANDLKRSGYGFVIIAAKINSTERELLSSDEFTAMQLIMEAREN